MKSIIFTLMLCMSLFVQTQAQPCASLTLTSQADIDVVICTSVTGNVLIQGTSNGDDIVNLDALSSITSIGGNLYISPTKMLKNIDSLSNLKSIGGYLRISDNDSLLNVDGLLGLESIGDYMTISYNQMLTKINLPSLNSVGTIFNITDNIMLTDVNGLSSLSSIGGYLLFLNNKILMNIDELSSLTSVGGFLQFNNNASLINVNFLSSLTSVGGFLQFINNTSLTNLDGLSSLSSVGPYVRINGNVMLSSYCGLFTLLDPLNLNGLAGSFLPLVGNLTNPTVNDIVDLGAACLPTSGAQPNIIGRDTSVCIEGSVDLSLLVGGVPINTLEYGTSFGTYNLISPIVSPMITTTYFVRDSSESTMLLDTAKITVTVLPQLKKSAYIREICGTKLLTMNHEVIALIIVRCT